MKFNFTKMIGRKNVAKYKTIFKTHKRKLPVALLAIVVILGSMKHPAQADDGAAKGALFGGLGGAALGGAIGGGKGAAIGAGVGLATGAIIGSASDRSSSNPGEKRLNSLYKRKNKLQKEREKLQVKASSATGSKKERYQNKIADKNLEIKDVDAQINDLRTGLYGRGGRYVPAA